MVFATSASVDMSAPFRMPGWLEYARPTSYTPRSSPSSGTCVVSTSVRPESTQSKIARLNASPS